MNEERRQDFLARQTEIEGRIGGMIQEIVGAMVSGEGYDRQQTTQRIYGLVVENVLLGTEYSLELLQEARDLAEEGNLYAASPLINEAHDSVCTTNTGLGSTLGFFTKIKAEEN